jgi:uncharacterized coiled-coil protein SlyX
MARDQHKPGLIELAAERESMDYTVEARIARLESDVAHVRTDVCDIKTDLRSLRDRMDTKFDVMETKLDALTNELSRAEIWALMLYIALAAGLFGTLAHSFGWI